LTERQSRESYRRNLPHLRMEGATYFVTWRVRKDRPGLTPEERTLVVDALRHFDGARYELHAYVVMDDHVHVLFEPRAGHSVEALVHSWKSFTAHQVARRTGRRGGIWLDEYFDRIVRDEAELLEKAQYIANNPHKRWPDLDRYPWVREWKDLSQQEAAEPRTDA
jgi:REP element-mobilizing transposase RayT